jgi:hypothetical protein
VTGHTQPHNAISEREPNREGKGAGGACARVKKLMIWERDKRINCSAFLQLPGLVGAVGAAAGHANVPFARWRPVVPENSSTNAGRHLGDGHLGSSPGVALVDLLRIRWARG